MQAVSELRLSPRVVLRPGDQFRTVRGSGPMYGECPLGPFSTFQVVRLESKRTRIFAECIDQSTGMTHTLYVAGPRFRSGDMVYRPFRLKRIA